MTFEEELKIRKDTFETNGGYNQNSMPKIYEYYKEYVATGQYPYLESVQKFILIKEVVDTELRKYLRTEVYLASQQHQRERDLAHAKEMIADGWTPLTTDVVKKTFANKQKITLEAEVDGMISTVHINRVYKPFVDDKGYCYLMKLRATRSGYPLHHFNNAFCKIIE